MKHPKTVVLALYILSQSVMGEPVLPRHISKCPPSESQSTFSTPFRLLAIDIPTNTTMTLAPVDNISFDEPGNLYFGGSPGFTFNLTNYSLSVGAGVAPCSLEPFAPTPSVGRIHCSTNPAARGGGNPYFSIHYDQSIGAPVLQVAYPNATGSIRACGTLLPSIRISIC